MEKLPKKEDLGPEIPFPTSLDGQFVSPQKKEKMPEGLRERALYKYHHKIPRTAEEDEIISQIRDEEREAGAKDNSGRLWDK